VTSIGAIHEVEAGVLSVASLRQGPRDGWPVVLLHGFPYDVHAYDEVSPLLAAAGADVVTPWLRGYGPTRFLAATTPRSGQQAALGRDLLALIDALKLGPAVVAGYDWGGRAACIAAALWPSRIAGLVSVNGYNIQQIAEADRPVDPVAERRYWYQYYLHADRGRRGLAANRRDFAQLLWQEWSPTWAAGPVSFAATAPSFDNPDFVDVVVHSYRHRFSLVAGDPANDADEQALAKQPSITVPTALLDGADDGVHPPDDAQAGRFDRLVSYAVLPGVGHDVPQEDPAAFAAAVISVHEHRPG
jgi:pimeloyl-ACP methyl ester carboxylesterase